MSVLIDMKMPKNCDECSYRHGCEISLRLSKRPIDCPIICEVPDKHGRLIDADALQIPHDICDGEEAMEFINDAPTVIPTEEERNIPQEYFEAGGN